MDLRKLAPGVAVAAACAAAAYVAARLAKPIVALDASLLALLFGLAAGLLLRHPKSLDAGAGWAVKKALAAGVVLLGFEINLIYLATAGPRALALALLVVPVTFLVAIGIARALKLGGDSPVLLAFGTGICGLSAVAAAGATLKSRDEDVTVAVAAIGFLSAIGVFLYPIIGLALEMPPEVFGAWSGASLHAVANAIAAGFALGDDAGRAATLVKMARVALLAPALVLAAVALRRAAAEPATSKPAWRKAYDWLPGMVWGFLAAVVVGTLVPIPEAVGDALASGAKALLLVGLAAVGYTARVGHVAKAGPRGITLAVGAWVVMSVVALAAAWWAYS